RLLINHEENQIQLSWQKGSGIPRTAPPVTFQHPFDKQVLEDLRWYLEEYISYPYGIASQRAERIDRQLKEWGESLFQLVFPKESMAWEFWLEATRLGLDQCEVGISSEDTAVLNMPWELLYTPERQFLAPSLAGIYRSFSKQAIRAEWEMPQENLNILIVIARPYGEKDAGIKMIARPVLEAIKTIHKQVNLKILRPPTFDQFQQELNKHRGFYHIVHFDGHGDFDPDSTGFQTRFGTELGQGVLIFETLDGFPHAVTAAEIAQGLENCRVPIFLLNSCRSGQAGAQPYSSIAGQMVSLGAKCVVSMSYSVYFKTARYFIGRLYEQLFSGSNIASAVAAGRRMLISDRQRPSPKGELSLQDWLVPVLYQQEDYIPLASRTNADSFKDLMEAESIIEKSDLPSEGFYSFVGRDYELLRLERAFRINSVVLVKGMGGIGKTEIAIGFANWLEQTNGRESEHIFFFSFRDGKGLGQIVNEIGRRLGGERFSQFIPDQQKALVLEYLKSHACLVIWDNFEPVNGFPIGNEPLLADEERKSLQKFVQELRGGKTWLLITSRQQEKWLGCGYELMEMHGLSCEDAKELSDKILRTAGIDISKLSENYLELLQILGGHPLALKVILPNLKSQSPEKVIKALQQGLTFQVNEDGGEQSLVASLNYSFKGLSEQTQRHLPFLGLFTEQVNARLLSIFSCSSDNNYSKPYADFFGENLQSSDWVRILNEGVSSGIFDIIDATNTTYRFHPILPWYLHRKLHEIHSEEDIKRLENFLIRFYADFASHIIFQSSNNPHQAMVDFDFERPNLLQSLRLAELRQNWQSVYSLLGSIAEVYTRLNYRTELNSLRKRALRNVGIKPNYAKEKGHEAFALWCILRELEGDEDIQNRDFEKAKRIYIEVLNELSESSEKNLDITRLYSIYSKLGAIAQKQQQFVEAEDFYQKALQIVKEESNRAASIYGQQGQLLYVQGRLDEARDRYQQGLQIFQKGGDEYMVAKFNFDLGNLAFTQRKFDEAENLYNQALQIFQQLQDPYHQSSSLHQLGLLAVEQRKFDDAIYYHREALILREDLGNPYDAAIEYNSLSNIAMMQGDYEGSIAYLQKSFAIWESVDNWSQTSVVLSQWGNTLQAFGQWAESINIYSKAFYLDQRHNQHAVSSDLRGLYRALQYLGESQFKNIWQEATGENCRQEVLEAILESSQSDMQFGGSFKGASFLSATITNSSFRDVDMREAIFTNSTLTGCDFSNVDLSGANFRGCDLSGSILYGTNLTGTDLTDAKVNNALLIGVIGLSDDEKLDLRHRGAILNISGRRV
ncbi:MAG: tetratricopeptide repeat protein, partial [Cytophagales bacterium]|nr:tetratricopeptide repeat protein [Cytophagales bacterium]